MLLLFTVTRYLRFFLQYTKIGDGNMGQKDIAEKYLENYNDVFADIINVLLAKGKQPDSAGWIKIKQKGRR